MYISKEIGGIVTKYRIVLKYWHPYVTCSVPLPAKKSLSIYIYTVTTLHKLCVLAKQRRILCCYRRSYKLCMSAPYCERQCIWRLFYCHQINYTTKRWKISSSSHAPPCRLRMPSQITIASGHPLSFVCPISWRGGIVIHTLQRI